MSPQYFWERDYTYNVFGANEILRVTLWRKTKKGNFKEVDSWEWSTFYSRGWANSRAEGRIRRLNSTYGAVPFEYVE